MRSPAPPHRSGAAPFTAAFPQNNHLI